MKRKDYIYIGLIIILALVIAFSTSNSRDLTMKKEILKQEITRHKENILNLEYEISEWNIVSELEKQKSKELKLIIDSLTKKTNEKPDPILRPVPMPNARNDSIVKWSKRFQRRRT